MTIILPDNRKPQPPAGILRGPANADAFRVKVGRYGERWYTDSLPACPIAPTSEATFPSVSTIKKAKPFEGADYVAMKRIAKELEVIPPANRIDSLPWNFAGMYERFKTINKLGLDAAGKRGTHVHKMFEQLLYGQPITEQGPGAHYANAVRSFFDAYQPELVAAELVTICRDIHGVGYGGTADAIVVIDGKRYLVDWKSRSEDGDHAAYPEEGAQLAAYASADYMIADGDNGMAKRANIPELDGALIVSVKPDGCRIYPVDLVTATSYFQSIYAWWLARRSEKDAIGRPWPTKVSVAVEQSRQDVPATDGGASHTPPVASGEAGTPSPAPAGDPFEGLVVSGEAPSLGVARKAPPKPAYSDDELINDITYEAFQKAFQALSADAKVSIKAVAEQAHAAGHSVSVAQRRSVRRFNIGTALMAWAEQRRSEDDLRAALFLATGHEDVLQPGIPVGAAVGVLTNDEAAKFVAVVTALADHNEIPDPATGVPVRWAA